jgi:hypothetical protein
MSKFKIVLKGEMKENGDMKWSDKLTGDLSTITTALSAELIQFTMNNGMSKQSFMKQIKRHYEELEKQDMGGNINE